MNYITQIDQIGRVTFTKPETGVRDCCGFVRFFIKHAMSNKNEAVQKQKMPMLQKED